MNDDVILLRPSIVDGELKITDQYGRPCAGLVDVDISYGAQREMSLNLKLNVLEKTDSGNLQHVIAFQFNAKAYETK